MMVVMGVARIVVYNGEVSLCEVLTDFEVVECSLYHDIFWELSLASLFRILVLLLFFTIQKLFSHLSHQSIPSQ